MRTKGGSTGLTLTPSGDKLAANVLEQVVAALEGDRPLLGERHRHGDRRACLDSCVVVLSGDPAAVDRVALIVERDVEALTGRAPQHRRVEAGVLHLEDVARDRRYM